MIFGDAKRNGRVGIGSSARARSAVAAAALLLAGCLKPAAIEAENAWVRLPAVAGRPAVAYFTLHGGEAPATLIGVTADQAVRAEMHESMAAGGTMTMRPIGSIPLPAGGTITFAPGGRHLMMFGLNPALKPGASTILTFAFADGSRLERKAWAIDAGDPAPE